MDGINALTDLCQEVIFVKCLGNGTCVYKFVLTRKLNFNEMISYGKTTGVSCMHICLILV